MEDDKRQTTKDKRQKTKDKRQKYKNTITQSAFSGYRRSKKHPQKLETPILKVWPKFGIEASLSNLLTIAPYISPKIVEIAIKVPHLFCKTGQALEECAMVRIHFDIIFDIIHFQKPAIYYQFSIRILRKFSELSSLVWGKY